MLMGVVKVLLQNNCRCLRINQLAAFLRDDSGRISFIHQDRLDAEASVQLIGETPATHRHFMFSAIRMQGQTDDAAIRFPFLYQAGQRRKLAVIGGGTDHLQRLRLFHHGIADCHADALQTEIEGQNRFHARIRSGVTGFGRQHHLINAEQTQRRSKPLLGRQVENDRGIGLDRQPAVVADFLFQLAGAPA